MRKKATTKPTAAHLRHPKVRSSIPGNRSAGGHYAQGVSFNGKRAGRTAATAFVQFWPAREKPLLQSIYLRIRLTVMARVLASGYDHENSCSALCSRICRSLYCARAVAAKSGHFTRARANETSGPQKSREYRLDSGDRRVAFGGRVTRSFAQSEAHS